MRILVLGASGFVGSAFGEAARAAGHQLLGLVRDDNAARRLREREITPAVGTLENLPWSEIGAFAPEACLHAAWFATPGAFWEAPENETCLAASLTFAHRLEAEHPCHLVTLGTCAEYGPSDAPLDEEASFVAPDTLYARCKNELRLSLESAREQSGGAFTWVRLFYPYGPGEPPDKLPSTLLRAARAGKPLQLHHHDSRRDYIFIDDVADALVAIVERRALGCFNLGTGEGLRLSDLARAAIESAGGGRLEAPITGRPDPRPAIVANISRIREATGWRPRVTVSEGLGRLAASVP